MSQASVVISDSNGATFRAALNAALLALISNNSGVSEPATTYANMLWYDTANNVLKIRNEANTDWDELLGDGVIAPASNTADYIPQWNGANSKTLKNGIKKSTDGTMAGNSDSAVPTEKAVTTYVAARHTALGWQDRGDPSGYDFQIGSGLTADGNYHDLDLSSIVPAGATMVLLRAVVVATNTDRDLLFRKNGNTNSYNVAQLKTYAANNVQDFIVACDTNRVVEYLISGSGITGVAIVVRGWLLKS